MRRLGIVAVAIALAASLAAAIGSDASAGKRGVLAGVWEATDLGDGSNVTMWLTQDGSHYDMLIYDNLCTGCDPDRPVNIFGEARLQGNVLSTTGEWWCLSASPTYLRSVSHSVTYDPSADTIVDPADGQTWHRR